MPEQVQDFYPTPSTLSTVMYYTGVDPRTMQPVYVPTDPKEKEMQRALIQYRDPKNAPLIRKALELAGRTDLIGTGPKCLVRPSRTEQGRPTQKPAKPSKPAKPARPAKSQKAVAGKTKRTTPPPPTARQLAAAERYLNRRKKK